MQLLSRKRRSFYNASVCLRDASLQCVSMSTRCVSTMHPTLEHPDAVSVQIQKASQFYNASLCLRCVSTMRQYVCDAFLQCVSMSTRCISTMHPTLEHPDSASVQRASQFLQCVSTMRHYVYDASLQCVSRYLQCWEQSQDKWNPSMMRCAQYSTLESEVSSN